MTDAATSGMPWYVAQTKPRQENLALGNLLRQGYGAYVPKLKVVRRCRGRQLARLEPMFPAYVLFQPRNEWQSIAPVRSTLGVTRVVCFGQIPATLTVKTVNDIRIVESRQNEANIEEISPIQSGIRVRVTDGPFAALEGLVASISVKRIEVLMLLMGKDIKVGFSPDSLVLAD